jgi:hypothetical protein
MTIPENRCALHGDPGVEANRWSPVHHRLGLRFGPCLRHPRVLRHEPSYGPSSGRSVFTCCGSATSSPATGRATSWQHRDQVHLRRWLVHRFDRSLQDRKHHRSSGRAPRLDWCHPRDSEGSSSRTVLGAPSPAIGNGQSSTDSLCVEGTWETTSTAKGQGDRSRMLWAGDSIFGEIANKGKEFASIVAVSDGDGSTGG